MGIFLLLRVSGRGNSIRAHKCSCANKYLPAAPTFMQHKTTYKHPVPHPHSMVPLRTYFAYPCIEVLCYGMLKVEGKR